MFSDDSSLGFKFSSSMSNVSAYSKSFYMVIMIFALLTFAKKAPELIGELLPNKSKSKLGFGASMKDIVGLSTAAKVGAGIAGGALGGTAIGLLSGSPGGMIGGFLKGGLSGLKGQGFRKTTSGAWKSERDAIKKMRDIRAQGGSWFGSHVASLQGALGMRNAYEEDKIHVDELNKFIKYQDEIEETAKNFSVVKRLERDYEAIKQAGRLAGESDEHYTTRIEVARQNWKRAMEATITSSMTGRQVDYHEAEMVQNAAGNWGIRDAVATSTIDFTAIPTNISGSINAKTAEMNRTGSGLGYAPASNYGDMDNINNAAQGDLAHYISQPSFSRNEANSGK